MSMITPKDDSFHPIMSADPHWTETWWSGFHVADQNMCGTIYFWTRPNLGICSVQAAVWDDTTEKTWELPYYRSLWHVPLPPDDLLNITADGLSIKCLESLKKYQILYKAPPKLELDLTYEALLPPHPTIYSEGMGHFDQPCRVTGKMILNREERKLDCVEMRDRSWYVRRDDHIRRTFYTYGIASETDAFHAMGSYTDEGCMIFAGFLMRDGEKADIVSGTRKVVERRNHYATRLVIEARDRLGRQLRVEGVCMNRIANQATPGMFSFMSLVRWLWDKGPLYGEDHDVNP